MIAIDPDIARKSIGEDTPSGVDAKYSPEYEALTAETVKLSSLQGSGSVNWDKVANLAVDILSTQSKDISIAAYLSVALAETDGLLGWETGTRVLFDIIRFWWEDGFPAKKRMRARINILSWWHDRTASFLERQEEAIAPELHASLLALLGELDQALAERMEDSPPLYDLREAINRIPLLEPVAVAPPPPAEDVSPVPPAPVEAPVAVPSTPAAPQPPVPESVSPETPLSEEEARLAFCAAAGNVHALFFATACPVDPLAWRAFFIALWGKIRQLPPETDGRTLIRPPDQDRLQAFSALLAKGKAGDVARAVALFAPESPLCLDVQRLLDSALEQAGTRFDEARLIIREEVTALLRRLPGLEQCCFADGTPFADGMTLDWLGQLTAQFHDSGAAADLSEVEETVRAATEEAAGQQLDKALERLWKARNGADGPDRLRLAAAEIRLLMRHGRQSLAAILAADVDAQLLRHDLATWQPDLCLKTLLTLQEVWRDAKDEEGMARGEALMARIARLRPSAALPLVRRTEIT